MNLDDPGIAAGHDGASSDDHRRLQFFVGDAGGGEPVASEDPHRLLGLIDVDLDQQMPARSQPPCGIPGYPSDNIEPVGTTVERDPWLVESGFARQESDGPAWDERNVGGDEIGAPLESRR